MKKYILFFPLFFIGLTTTAYSQTIKLRSGIFLHHSTGECIWGPNGSATSIPQEIVTYNTNNRLTGDNAVTMTDYWWPSDDNEWATWHGIFYNADPNNDIRPILQNNRIVVIKSCFPSSNISDVGSPADTLDPTNKTIYNYKWHWRSILRIMKDHPDNFFTIWTNAPLVANETNDQEAHLSDKFCRWAKDTLATGADPIFSHFPSNVYVFDFFHKLANSSGKLPWQYASGEWDSHPKSLATELVAPQFVKEIFDAAIAYEASVHIRTAPLQSPLSFQLDQNYPNPFNSATAIRFQLPVNGFVTLKVYEISGREITTLVDGQTKAGSYSVSWDGKTDKGNKVSTGLYLYRLQAESYSQIRRCVFLK